MSNMSENKEYFFERTSPESVGLPSYTISGLLNNLEKENIELHSIMILRHGKVCAEGWWQPYSKNQLHNVHSFTKSFVSSAFGMLVEEGKASTEDYVLSYFPEEAPENPSENLKNIKVRHLLSMSCGHHEEPRIRDKDFVKAFLSHPVDHEPGIYFRYNSSATHLVSRIIHKITGKDFLEFLEDRLFKPMGFGEMSCSLNVDGFPSGGGGLALKTEDMAKLAQIYLNNGKWNGEELIPEKWIETATKPQVDNSNGEHRDGNEDWEAGYGYQMWMNKNRHSYRFDGAFGQEAFVCPDEDLAVIFTAASYRLGDIFELIRRYILNNLSDAALPENAGAAEELKNKLDSLTLPELKVTSKSLMQDAASGKKLKLQKNNLTFIASGSFMNEPILEGATAITPIFEGNSLSLLIENEEKSVTLNAGMNGEAIKNVIETEKDALELYASAKWLDQNILSVTYRTLKIVRSTNLIITYHLNDADISVEHPLRGKAETIKATY